MSLGPFGLAAERPVALLRDAIQTARDVFGGVDSDRYDVPAHAAPPRDVPIWVGARGPQLVRTAAQHADGLFLSGCTLAQHDEIISNAASVRQIPVAVYQSALDSPVRPSEQNWDAAHRVLDKTLAKNHPASIGINLVDLMGDPSCDPVRLVERAAELLHSLQPGC